MTGVSRYLTYLVIGVALAGFTTEVEAQDCWTCEGVLCFHADPGGDNTGGTEFCDIDPWGSPPCTEQGAVCVLGTVVFNQWSDEVVLASGVRIRAVEVAPGVWTATSCERATPIVVTRAAHDRSGSASGRLVARVSDPDLWWIVGS